MGSPPARNSSWRPRRPAPATWGRSSTCGSGWAATSRGFDRKIWRAVMGQVEPMADRRLHETLAKQINGEVWSLLDQSDRTEEDDERMVLAAHASCYHWLHAGTSVHRQRGGGTLAPGHTGLGRGAA